MNGTGYQRLDGVGQASIFKGDPRLPKTDIDEWLETLLENNPARAEARPYLYGSDAGFCARRNVLLEHNDALDANINAAGTAYMAIGVAFEDMLAAALRRAGRLVVQGRRIIWMPELKISGKMDLVIFDQDDELALVEVKTCGELPVAPKPTHLAQVKTYAAVTGIRKVHLVYLSRNLRPLQPIPTRSFAVDTSDDSLLGVLETAALSRLASDQHLLPPTPAHFRKHTECHYCEFRDYFCHGSRPGLGGAAATSPMQDLSVPEHISLVERSQRLAAELLANREWRRVQTLEDLLLTEGILAPHSNTLHQLLQEAKARLALDTV